MSLAGVAEPRTAVDCSPTRFCSTGAMVAAVAAVTEDHQVVTFSFPTPDTGAVILQRPSDLHHCGLRRHGS